MNGKELESVATLVSVHTRLPFFFFFFKDFIYLFLEREGGREGGREGEKHPSIASHMLPTRDLALT